MSILNLRVNRMANPMGIDHKDIVFSFISDQKACTIRGYDESKSNILWCKTVNAQDAACFRPAYDFEPGKKYYWSVSSNNETSEEAFFETGIDFTSVPVISPAAEISHPNLYRDFQAAGPVEKARLYIAGLGLYVAYLNGIKVGDQYLTPGYNDYDAYVRYQTYDVTHLIASDNQLQVTMGDGWFKGRFGTDGHGGEIYGSNYYLAAQLIITHKSGSETIIMTDETWTATDSVYEFSNIYDGEIRNDNNEFCAPIPCIVADRKFNFIAPTGAPVRVKHELKPTLYISPKGEQILDFGQNMVGFCRFICREYKGTVIHLQYGEVLQNQCFYRDNLRSAKSELWYTSDGYEKVIEEVFTFHGFRYVKVEGFSNIDPEDFTGVVLYTDLPETLSCVTDSPKINQLIHNALWGQKGNFLDVPTDCPQRDERMGWTGDAQAFCNTACYQMDCYPFYKKFMEDMRADQTMYSDGDIPMVVPSMKGVMGLSGGAVWADAATIIPWNLYMAFGDKKLLERSYAMMRDYMDVLVERDLSGGNSHLMKDGFTFGDWLAQDGVTPQARMGGTDTVFIKTVYYHYSAKLVSKAASVLGKKDDSRHYASISRTAKKALLKEYFTPNGKFSLDTQCSYVLALYYGIYTDKQRVIDDFKLRLKKDFYKIKCGFTGTPLLLPVLFDNGMDDEAYRILYNEECPSWLYAVNLGATTIWERWNSLLPDGTISGTSMNSLNHYAYGSVCEAIYSRIAGLKVGNAGWKSAEIAPHLNYRMKHMRLAFDSPRGSYQIAWDINEENQFSMEVTIPAGCTASVTLPHHPEHHQESIGQGTHRYMYQLTKDLNHPFSESSFVLDLLKNPIAEQVIKENLPMIYSVCAAEDAEYRIEHLHDLAWLPMFRVAPQVLAEVSSKLRRISA